MAMDGVASVPEGHRGNQGRQTQPRGTRTSRTRVSIGVRCPGAADLGAHRRRNGPTVEDDRKPAKNNGAVATAPPPAPEKTDTPETPAPAQAGPDAPVSEDAAAPPPAAATQPPPPQQPAPPPAPSLSLSAMKEMSISELTKIGKDLEIAGAT